MIGGSDAPPAFHDVPEDSVLSGHPLIRVHDPKPFSVVRSPLTVRGEARGVWYFEGDFPMVLATADGQVLEEWYASAQLDPEDPASTWMAPTFVPFEGTLEFSVPDGVEGTDGILILRKNNPSDLPELDDEVHLPVIFGDGWSLEGGRW